jgi:hypothetical protein
VVLIDRQVVDLKRNGPEEVPDRVDRTGSHDPRHIELRASIKHIERASRIELEYRSIRCASGRRDRRQVQNRLDTFNVLLEIVCVEEVALSVIYPALELIRNVDPVHIESIGQQMLRNSLPDFPRTSRDQYFQSFSDLCSLNAPTLVVPRRGTRP